MNLKDKTPPHDNDVEQAVLGSILIDMEGIDKANIGIKLKPDDFYSRANQRIFEAMLNLRNKGMKIDVLTLVVELKSTGKLDEAGGQSYIESLTKTVPNSANIKYYTQVVKMHSLRRAILKQASEFGIAAYDETKNPIDTIKAGIENLNNLIWVVESKWTIERS